MRIFLAGASGAVGRRLVPLLVGLGHQVTATTRSPGKVGALRQAGATPVIADGLDRDAVMRSVAEAAPHVVIHQMTALANIRSYRRFDEVFALTNQLRVEGTDHLIEAAVAAGARRFIAQSFGNWTYAKTGSGLKHEDDAFDADPPAHQRRSLAAIRHLEASVTSVVGLQGIVLRYGNLYGPGTELSPSGDITATVRRRAFPIIGDGEGVWSFVHVEDAATAAALAVDRGPSGPYNIVDDEPAAVRVWLPELARILGAKPPPRVPLWVGRLAAGDVGVSLMTRIRGVSNEKAKRELDWRPRFASWREGLRFDLGRDSPASGGSQ